jgi:glutamine synthetase
VENRGVLVRVQGGPGDASSHVEMRSGEPAANPYLYMASNIAAGLDGISRDLALPAPVDADPYVVDARRLPASLAEAVDALEGDNFYRKAFGDAFIDYLVTLKRAEIKRYEAHLTELASAGTPVADPHGTVTDWETREYFEFY